MLSSTIHSSASTAAARGLSQLIPLPLSFLYPTTARLLSTQSTSHQTSSSGSVNRRNRQFSSTCHAFASNSYPSTSSSSFDSSTTTNSTPPPISTSQSHSPNDHSPTLRTPHFFSQSQQASSPTSTSTSSTSTSIPSDEACASLSPSSPSAPRSQRTKSDSPTLNSTAGAKPASSAPVKNVSEAIVPEQGEAPPPGPTPSQTGTGEAQKPKVKSAANRGTRFTGKKAAISLVSLSREIGGGFGWDKNGVNGLSREK